MNTQRQIFLIVALLFVNVAGCAAYTAIDLPVRADRQADFFESESIERGALLFANNCRTCHGIRGEGGVGLTLNKSAFRNQDPLVLSQNQALIRRTLECGRAGTLMPAWLTTNGGSLTANQIGHLVRLLTAPLEEGVFDALGDPTNDGWLATVEFAHNLNHESSTSITGDTLDLIAAAHGIGAAQVAALNGFRLGASELTKGERLDLPDGRRVKAENNDTVAKLAQREHVGAIMIAELNGIAYEIDDSGTFFLPYRGDDEALVLDPEADQRATGLLPGRTLALPAGATFLVRAGDTLAGVAEQHGVSPGAIRTLNARLLGEHEDSDEIGAERRLLLPDGTAYHVQEGDTVADIADAHDLPVLVLAEDNSLDVDAVVLPGDTLVLREGSGYIAQFGDTVAAIAAAHGLDEGTLRALNVIDPGVEVTTEVVIALPPIRSYVVQGGDLAQTAAGFGNVTATTLGEANGVAADAVLPIGKVLAFPEDAWGSAPPDQLNPGTACVEHAVSPSTFDTLPGVGTGPIEIDEPEATSAEVAIQAHANDWTVVADGEAGEPNRAGVKVAAGTEIVFDNLDGVHAINIDGEKQGEDIVVGETRSISFDDPGEFRITCSYHPDMLAVVFVE